MGIKTYNPYTPSRRNMTGLDFVEITKSTPEKSLLAKKDKTAGRNNQGKITVRHHGGGNRQKYRMIDFKRRKDDVPAIVKSIEYDPNRTANIALLHYADGEKAYIIAPVGLKVGDELMNGANAEIKIGNCLPLENIPVGTEIHNIELYPGKGAQFVRSAGNSAQLIPNLLRDGRRMYAYHFNGYWKDVGTIPALWEANMEVLDPEHSGINLFDENWKIYSHNSGHPSKGLE